VDGRVLKPLDEAAVRAAGRHAGRGGRRGDRHRLPAFLARPRTRRARAEILRARILGPPLSLSAAVAPEIREFERISTACANAYVQPLMARYLDRLEASARGDSASRAQLYVMLSGGGIATVRRRRTSRSA
jgi:N-methylhydantoinase A